MKKFFSLFFLHLKLRLYHLVEGFKVFFFYYRSFRFFLIDLSLKALHIFHHPYRICKKASLIYGETPLSTLDLISKECRVLSKDVVFELGCGRGRSSFWLAHFIRCEVLGVDCIPLFIKKANLVTRLFGSTRVSFKEEDLFRMDLRRATVIYLYGSTLSQDEILKLIEKFPKKRELKIITVSFSLAECAPELFKIQKQFKASFPWGKADVFLNTFNAN